MDDRDRRPSGQQQWHVPAPPPGEVARPPERAGQPPGSAAVGGSGPVGPEPSGAPPPRRAAATPQASRGRARQRARRGGRADGRVAEGSPSAPPRGAPAGRARGGGGGVPGRGIRRALRPKLRWFTLYLPLLLVLLVLLAGVWVWRTVGGLDRVELGDALAQPTGDVRNYLIVGSDSREGITEDTPNVGAIGTDVTGRRADTIIVLRVEPGASVMMSIPRDLWVTNPATGKEGRVNATYAAGPDNLVRTVTGSLGIPIHHYVEVDFVSFAGMVDAMGGVTIDFEHPATDRGSGLNITEAGPQRLDGPTALAYVRARNYTEIIDGKPVKDPTADLGRQERQQRFIRTVLGEAGATRNPITAARIAGAATKGARVDTAFGVGDMWDLARRLSGTDPESLVLPTAPARKGNAAVLVLKEAEAAPVLARFQTS